MSMSLRYLSKCLLKHKNFLDVCFFADDISINSNNNDIKLFGYWINMGYNESWLIDPYSPETIIIPFNKLNEWEITEDTQKCLRNSKWEPITLDVV